jgi:glycosyltransferase involved in cell wall biosynthesis
VRVLLLSTVFPNATQPALGVFVRTRACEIARRCAVQVVAPVPWFPFNRVIRGRHRADVPLHEAHRDFDVHHPRVFSLPAVGKSLDAFFYFASILPFLRRLRRSFPFDVIDSHFAYPDGVAAVLLGKVLRCPVALTMRGNEVTVEHTQLRRRQMAFALRHARTAAVSEPLRDLAVRLGATRERVRVIPNGVDQSLFHRRDQNAARAALGLPIDGPIVVSVGTFVADKGHELIIDLLPALRRVHPELLYVAVGNPGGGDSRLRAIERRIGEEQLADCVRLAVGRPHDEIPLWLAAADVFCLATAREGCSNSILEALACGLPVVATRVGGNGDLVRDGVDGFLVSYFDAAAFKEAILAALSRRWDRDAIARSRTRSWKDVGN